MRAPEKPVDVVIADGKTLHLRHHAFGPGDVVAVTAGTAEQLVANGTAKLATAPPPPPPVAPAAVPGPTVVAADA